MHSRFLIFAGTFIAIAVVTAQVRDSRTSTESGITRRLVIDEKTVQVVRSTYASGAVEPPGPPHSFDVVLVPLTAGNMRVEISGKTATWKVGEPIFIPRGTEHIMRTGEKQQWSLYPFAFPKWEGRRWYS